MKWILTVFVLACISLSCWVNSNKIETHPWSKSQVETMKDDEIKTVPFLIVRF
jgi:hypothetical protein